MKRNASDIVLVTGSSGFIGRAVVARLGKSYTVIAGPCRSAESPAAVAEAIDVDLKSDESVHAALERVRAGVAGALPR
jgi:uncharacterized protein YbjT (DUF2867 family)